MAQWARERDGATEATLRARFGCDAAFREILAACHARQLKLLHFERGSSSYWGGSLRKADGVQVGENRLGRMLMELAQEAAAQLAATRDGGTAQEDVTVEPGAAPAQAAAATVALMCVLAGEEEVAAGGCLVRIVAPELEPRSPHGTAVLPQVQQSSLSAPPEHSL